MESKWPVLCPVRTAPGGDFAEEIIRSMAVEVAPPVEVEVLEDGTERVTTLD